MSTILISSVVAVLFLLALRHVLKKGTCSGCVEKDSCPMASSGGCKSCSGCHQAQEATKH